MMKLPPLGSRVLRPLTSSLGLGLGQTSIQGSKLLLPSRTSLLSSSTPSTLSFNGLSTPAHYPVHAQRDFTPSKLSYSYSTSSPLFDPNLSHELHQWEDILPYVFTHHPFLVGDEFPKTTADFKGTTESQIKEVYSEVDHTLIPRLIASLSTFLDPISTTDIPSSNQIRYSAQAFVSFEIDKFEETVGDAVKPLLDRGIFGLAEAATLARGGPAITTRLGCPELVYHQKGDRDLEVFRNGLLLNRIALELKGVKVLIAHLKVLLQTHHFYMADSAISGLAMLAKIILQMAAESSEHEKAARFGIFTNAFCGVVVELVVDGSLGFLHVSPAFSLASQPLPFKQIRKRKPWPVAPPSPFISIVLAMMLDGVVPGLEVARPSPDQCFKGVRTS